jgi:regulator of protease activity HflC (stomatin/prohibitin superfamily)
MFENHPAYLGDSAMDVVVLTLAIFVVLIAVTIIFSSFFVVGNMDAAIIERFGKFERVAYAGLNWKTPFIERIAVKVSLQLTQLRLSLEASSSRFRCRCSSSA